MKKDFEIIDHTADVGIRAYGADLSRAFTNAAKALSSLIINLDDIQESLHQNIELVAPDEESLLVSWLNELIYLFDTEHIIFKRFNITKISETQLKARIYGEKIDISIHKLKTGIKAATYHMLRIRKDKGYRIQVLFDI